jgi:hypothetical protein
VLEVKLVKMDCLLKIEVFILLGEENIPECKMVELSPLQLGLPILMIGLEPHLGLNMMGLFMLKGLKLKEHLPQALEVKLVDELFIIIEWLVEVVLFITPDK